MDELEFNTIKKRIKELNEMNQVDNAARIERVAIEEALVESPYKYHLYTERDFDHLIFLELRELNTKLDKFFAHIAPAASGGVCNCGCAPADTSQVPVLESPIEVQPGSSPMNSETSVLHGDGGVSEKTTPRKSTTRRKK